MYNATADGMVFKYGIMEVTQLDTKATKNVHFKDNPEGTPILAQWWGFVVT